MKLRVERVEGEKLGLFLAMLRDIAIWLEKTGNAMWSLEGLSRERFLQENGDAELYLCYCGAEPAGAFMLKTHNEFWWPESREGEDLFLKKLGVARAFAGCGVSAYILDWVKKEAPLRGIKRLRIEFYADRDNLVKLYGAHGFVPVRHRTMPDGVEIAFYQYTV